MHKRFYSSHWFEKKNQLFLLFPTVKMNTNYGEIRTACDLEADSQQVPVV